MTAKNSIAMTQNRRVLITTPFPTPDEVAAALGVSPERHAEIKRMVDEIYAESTRQQGQKLGTISPKRRAKPAKKK